MVAAAAAPEEEGDRRQLPPLPPLPAVASSSVAEGEQVAPMLPGAPASVATPLPEEHAPDALKKLQHGHKRRSGNSVDLTYRYREPRDDELSWTEDENGNRRRRNSRKRNSAGAGDDFKTGIMFLLEINHTHAQSDRRQEKATSPSSKWTRS